jgi:hypothetical protein
MSWTFIAGARWMTITMKRLTYRRCSNPAIGETLTRLLFRPSNRLLRSVEGDCPWCRLAVEKRTDGADARKNVCVLTLAPITLHFRLRALRCFRG